MKRYAVKFLGQSDGLLTSIYATVLAAETAGESRTAALRLLPFVSDAIGFSVVDDESHAQVDLYLPKGLDDRQN